ncbi:cell elongation-specific peptidoglycan D,D-transpeptidase [Lentzea waywayandensis]|uniref:Cell elongation-specific peptidoglycan D,D-transpeptidase n=1 Tax=Lentzea waywayandensis TaxID=84724 RepID=A0A1I6EHE0_9PSEU|nr:penicillin-binding protein 2 [Lentzea waywayandensis]SFR17115.1 cell elongation-specific peptidoglycan D,D-transpeptidase [Lentzea waywayandensis]
MNTPLRRVGMAMMVMILLLLGNATWVQVINADEWRKNAYNRRVLLDEYARKRGLITVADGTVIADVKETSDRLRFLRTYNNGPVYAPVTGYLSVTYGTSGMERAENDLLNGSDDRLFARRVSALITGRDPVGGNVQLTLNAKVQQTAYDQLTAKGFTGSVVAIKPDTGEILAMASTPSYDPNLLASHDVNEQAAAWKQLTAKDSNDPLVNRATQALYPAGSTLKVVVAAAALADGKNKDTPYTAKGSITLPGSQTPLPNFNGTPCGPGETVPMETALAKSCNTAFGEMAGQLGANKLRRQAEKFGFNDPDLAVPLVVETSTLGSIPDDAALYQTGIGQRDVQITPLENAVVAATIANNGKRMQPYLVSKILGPDLKSIDDTEPDQVETAMSTANANALRDMMIQSEINTGGEGRLQNVQVASKTGTAEHGTDALKNNPHAWYIAFAPAQKPEIAIAVIVEDGGDRGLGATGGKVAAPIGRAVMNAYLAGR